MPVKVVFFDMGETLCYQSPATPHLLGEFLAERGISRGERELRAAYLGAMDYYCRWAMRLETADRTQEQLDAMVAGFYDVMFNALGVNGDRSLTPAARQLVLDRRPEVRTLVYADVLPALRALRERGLRLGIISNWDSTLVSLVHKLNLTDYFEAVIGSDNVGLEKPNGVIFEFALKRMGVKPAEAYHVGDMYYMDVLGARGAGLRPVLVDRYGLQPKVDCTRVESLTELPRILDEVEI